MLFNFMQEALLERQSVESLTPPQRLVVIYNPVATEAEKAKLEIEKFRALDRWDSCEWLETTAEGGYVDELHEPVDMDKVLENATPTTFVAVGGDGTHRDALRLGVPTILYGAGRKNDLAHMLGGKYYNNLPGLLEHGKKQIIHPLKITLTPDDPQYEKREEIAYNSWGTGITAVTSRLVNRPEFRQAQKNRGKAGKWIAEHLLALDAILRTGTTRTSHGKTMELSAIAGKRVAGNALKYDTELAYPHEFIVAYTRPNLPSVVGTLIARTLGRGFGDRWINGVYTATIHDDVEAHADGEKREKVRRGTMQIQRGEGVVAWAVDQPKYEPGDIGADKILRKAGYKPRWRSPDNKTLDRS